MSDCLFCKFVAREIVPDVVAESEHSLAFRDINPQAPVHVLVIPRDHHANVGELAQADAELTASLMVAATAVARAQELSSGYRVVLNTGADGGQTVDHVHAHVLGGRHLTWPPG